MDLRSNFTTDDLIAASKDMSISQIMELFHYKLLQIPDFYFLNNPYTQIPGFFRGRNHNHELGMLGKEFTTETEFWNPPIDLVKTMGRCNNIGESFLYCSNKLSTSIIETRPTVGQYITVANFSGITDEKGELNALDIAHVGVDDLKKMAPFDESLSDIDLSDQSEESKELDGVINEIFQHKIDLGYEHIYKLSIALTRFYLDMFSGEMPLHGMIYPSVLRDKKSYNILLWPGVAQKNFIITDVITYKVLDLHKNAIDLEIIRRGEISSDFSPGQCFRRIDWDPKEFPTTKVRIEIFDHPTRADFFTLLQ